ncbi:MAG TPA: DUF4352 domain-containing protein [Pyrinomonadaceae bacterium]|nr:DUF4352 domain-containing protein [Pyrinomonadaceae bacterium]
MGVLLVAMTIGGLALAAVLLIAAIAMRKSWLRTFTFGGVAAWFVFYFAMLLAFSLTSKESDLGLNQPKEFCGFYLDCHMHTAVTGVRQTKTIGNKEAKGEFYIVTVKVFSNAKQATLGLLSVDAHVVDATGREYSRDSQAETLLPTQPEFERKIAPVENFEKEIVFDLPVDIASPRLDIREGYGIDHVIESLLVDDEDSVLHKRAYFKLEASAQTAAIK